MYINFESVYCRSVTREDLNTVFELLQDVSQYWPEEFLIESIWQTIQNSPHIYCVVVVLSNGLVEQVVGYGSICINLKIRGGAIGHIEDIVVAPEFRGLSFGKLIVRSLTEFAHAKNCYKVSLECRPNKVSFYEQLGFASSGNAMSMLLFKDKK